MPSPPELAVTAPFAGVVVEVAHPSGGKVRAGAPLVVLEAMKMEHEVVAETDGVVYRIEVAVGDVVTQGDVLVVLLAGGHAEVEGGAEEPIDGATPSARAAEQERADVQAVRDRHALGLDAARPEAVARRRERGRRTARENLADLLDEGTFVEYGPLIFAAQERRRSRDELISSTPADGLVGGVGEVDGHPAVAMSYDYTVLAGTQGMRGHLKKDRLFELAERRRLPVVLFAEGGGG
jgi:pyruvate/2-oxoglutarate dehydrogenase complex dihydrolipoamide acyltransferase (E2) component